MCGWWLPVWTNQPLMLPAVGNEVVLDDSDLGALNLSFPICEVKRYSLFFGLPGTVFKVSQSQVP